MAWPMMRAPPSCMGKVLGDAGGRELAPLSPYSVNSRRSNPGAAEADHATMLHDVAQRPSPGNDGCRDRG